MTAGCCRDGCPGVPLIASVACWLFRAGGHGNAVCCTGGTDAPVCCTVCTAAPVCCTDGTDAPICCTVGTAAPVCTGGTNVPAGCTGGTDAPDCCTDGTAAPVSCTGGTDASFPDRGIASRSDLTRDTIVTCWLLSFLLTNIIRAATAVKAVTIYRTDRPQMM